jgi:hypothetical protein
MAESWSDTPEICVDVVHCPVCLTLDPIRVKSYTKPSGDIVRWYICRRCSKRFRWRIVKSFPVGESSIETNTERV